MPEPQEPFIGEDGVPAPTLGELVNRMMRNRASKLAANAMAGNALLRLLDTPEHRARLEADRLEEERIELLLSLEYGPAIEPQHPWWECDCDY